MIDYTNLATREEVTIAQRKLYDRFIAKYYVDSESGCWIWTAARNSSGYGQFSIGSFKTQPAHRVAWMMYRGAIPAGRSLEHICRVRHCINPNHLRIITPALNALENSVSPIALNAALRMCRKCGGPLKEKVRRKCTRSRRYCPVCYYAQPRYKTLNAVLHPRKPFRFYHPHIRHNP
jgi:hypothetical protein